MQLWTSSFSSLCLTFLFWKTWVADLEKWVLYSVRCCWFSKHAPSSPQADALGDWHHARLFPQRLQCQKSGLWEMPLHFKGPESLPWSLPTLGPLSHGSPAGLAPPSGIWAAAPSSPRWDHLSSLVPPAPGMVAALGKLLILGVISDFQFLCNWSCVLNAICLKRLVWFCFPRWTRIFLGDPKFECSDSHNQVIIWTS